MDAIMVRLRFDIHIEIETDFSIGLLILPSWTNSPRAVLRRSFRPTFVYGSDSNLCLMFRCFAHFSRSKSLDLVYARAIKLNERRKLLKHLEFSETEKPVFLWATTTAQTQTHGFFRSNRNWLFRRFSSLKWRVMNLIVRRESDGARENENMIISLFVVSFPFRSTIGSAICCFVHTNFQNGM